MSESPSGDGYQGCATLTAEALTGGTLTIYGQAEGIGSLKVSGAVGTQVKNVKGQEVYGVAVEVSGFQVSGFKFQVSGLEECGVTGACVVDGRVYLWLPNGEYKFSLWNGNEKVDDYCAVVDEWPVPQAASGRTAAAFYRIPAAAKLAEADAGQIAAWATAKGISAASFVTAPDTYEQAFLLNCAPNAVEAERAAYRILGFGQNADGELEIAVKAENTKKEPYYGKSVIKSFSDAACTVPAEEGKALFVRASLQVAQAGEVSNGTDDLEEPKWQEIPAGTKMEESDCSFFKLRIGKIEE